MSKLTDLLEDQINPIIKYINDVPNAKTRYVLGEYVLIDELLNEVGRLDKALTNVQEMLEELIK